MAVVDFVNKSLVQGTFPPELETIKQYRRLWTKTFNSNGCPWLTDYRYSVYIYMYTLFVESKYAVELFLYLCKAFNTSQRKNLSKKLEYYGIDNIEKNY